MGKPKKGQSVQARQEAMVVFAFRLTAEQREIIHSAAGRGQASAFVLQVALDAARKATLRAGIKGKK